MQDRDVALGGHRFTIVMWVHVDIVWSQRLIGNMEASFGSR